MAVTVLILFVSGIPDNPALANTYYSQFNEDFTPSDEDDDENAQTVVPRDDDDDILFGSSTEFTVRQKDDEDEFYNHLQYVLDKDEDAGMG